MTKDELDQLVRDYTGLFNRVLARCGIIPGQVNYEDELQDLRLLFFLRAKKYESREVFEAENDITYLFRFLLWDVVDSKRKKIVESYDNSEEILFYLSKEETLYEEIDLLNHIQYFYGQLLPKDQEKCLALLSDKTLTRQTRSRYRKYFSKHFKTFFQKGATF